MKKATKFGDFYKDSRWQQKRLEIMERDKWTCQSCGKSGEGVTLNVHHAYYESGKKPWEYPARCFVTWCEDCHKERHQDAKDINVTIARMNSKEYRGLFYMLYIAEFPRFFKMMSRFFSKEHYSISDSALSSCLVGLMHQAKESEGEA